MSGSRENTAPSASEQPERREVVLNLATAGRMITLVRQIVVEVQEQQRGLNPLRRELEFLDQSRRSLDWPQRQRRYQIRDEVIAGEKRLQEAMTELDSLGVALIDADSGQIGFPTLVNDRPAFFSWKPGEDGLNFWHFAGEEIRRPIPSSWVKVADLRLLGKG